MVVATRSSAAGQTSGGSPDCMHGRSSAADSKREIHIVDAEPGVVEAAL